MTFLLCERVFHDPRLTYGGQMCPYLAAQLRLLIRPSTSNPKLAMCNFLSINWKEAVDRYKRKMRAKRALDASAITVARSP